MVFSPTKTHHALLECDQDGVLWHHCQLHDGFLTEVLVGPETFAFLKQTKESKEEEEPEQLNIVVASTRLGSDPIHEEVSIACPNKQLKKYHKKNVSNLLCLPLLQSYYQGV